MSIQQYGTAFFDEIQQSSLTAARIIIPHLVELVDPKSVIDVGCGRGAWLRAWTETGVTQVLGVDGSYVQVADLLIESASFRAHDLDTPLTLDQRFDLALSLETAEHLKPARAESFVADLVALAPAVYFSAAIPRQGGVGHVNERPQSYWAGLFGSHGYSPIDEVRKRIWDDPDAGEVYAQNGLLYVASELCLCMPALADWVAETDCRMIDVVHPGIHRRKDSFTTPEEAGLARWVRSFPYQVKATLARRKRDV